MEDYKFRLLDEVTYLDGKMASLENFITSDNFKQLKWRTRIHLRIQLFYMRRYYFWLVQRMSYTCSPQELEEYARMKHYHPDPTPEKPKTKRTSKKNK